MIHHILNLGTFIVSLSHPVPTYLPDGSVGMMTLPSHDLNLIVARVSGIPICLELVVFHHVGVSRLGYLQLT